MRRRNHEYVPAAVYHLAGLVKARGIDLAQAIGPWRAGARRASRPGAVITNEHTLVAVDTTERAVDLAGLLNWCGVHDLNPVPELIPGTSAP
jgi:hypothetical protein